MKQKAALNRPGSGGGDGVEVADYTLLPLNAAQRGKPWTQIELRHLDLWGGWSDYHSCDHGWVRITARWGWPEAPQAIRSAIMVTAARLLDRRLNVAGAVTDQRPLPFSETPEG